MQGKAERLSPLLDLLLEFYREELAMTLRHQAGARLIGLYDVTNTYQYIVNREDMRLSWLAAAIADLGGGPVPGVAHANRGVSGKGASAARAVIEADARDAQAFANRRRPRVEALTNATQPGMLRVILGERLEQERFFDQALEGRSDLLGRRGLDLGPSRGEVLPARWVE